MNGATNSGNCSGLTHSQVSNSGRWVASLMSAFVPLNRIANHFLAIAAVPAAHPLGNLVRHIW